MLKLQSFLLCLSIMLSMIWISAADQIDLIETSCQNDDDCGAYEDENIRAKCVKENCRCVNTETDERISCRPNVLTRTNIIGGYCPCTMPFSRCQIMHDLCYCQSDYLASHDRRRCLPERVNLDDDCETDMQCKLNDVFSTCDMVSNRCRCKEGFIPVKGRCTPLYGTKNCSNRLFCDYETSHATCNETYNRCICNRHYITGNSSDVCLPGRTLNQTCVHDNQCLTIMGLGSKCVQNQCTCVEDYVVIRDKLYDDKEYSPMTMKCEPKAYAGKYCRINEDCHNRHLEYDMQPLTCKRTECVCKRGKRNANPCNKAASTAPVYTLWLIGIHVIVIAISLVF